jgi:polyferredoxin
MPKRKAARKQKARHATQARQSAPGKAKPAAQTRSMPVPALAIKILSVILAVILVISLTLYVLGRMPARGFWVLVVILAVIAFGVLPWMRRKFCGA